jgi:hypothetical protein
VIPDLFWALAVLILAPIVLFLIMLLPTFLELKKPKDPGPRLIISAVEAVTATPLSVGIDFLLSMEGTSEFQVKPVPNVLSVLGFLPNIDI